MTGWGDGGPSYIVFAVEAAHHADGQVVALEDDPDLKAQLHRRVDELKEDVLTACVERAGQTGVAPRRHESEQDWSRRLLHEGVDEVLSTWNPFVAKLRLDGCELILSGGFQDEMASINARYDDGFTLYASLAALSASGITGEPLPKPLDDVSPFDHSRTRALRPLRQWMAAHLRDAMNEAGVAAKSPVRARVEHLLATGLTRSDGRSGRTFADVAAVVHQAASP